MDIPHVLSASEQLNRGGMAALSSGFTNSLRLIVKNCVSLQEKNATDTRKEKRGEKMDDGMEERIKMKVLTDKRPTEEG